MVWFDLLYPSEKKWEQGKAGGKVSVSLAHDLQLERLVEDHALNREGYEGICQELDHLPVDREVILFRQEVLQDLIHNPHFLDKCSDFCKRLKNTVPTKRDIWNPSDPVYKNMEEHIGMMPGSKRYRNDTYFPACSLKIECFAAKTDERHMPSAIAGDSLPFFLC